MSSCSLYLITPPHIHKKPFSKLLSLILDLGCISFLQLRLKNTSDYTICKTCEYLLPLVKQRNIPLFLNDRPDLAAKTYCDGVHLGQKDTPYTTARKILGPNAIIGITCHNKPQLALQASHLHAQYIAFGTFFSTTTKKTPFRTQPQILTRWRQQHSIPTVAIGGITPLNAPTLIHAGANYLAVMSAIWYHPHPLSVVRHFHNVLQHHTS